MLRQFGQKPVAVGGRLDKIDGGGDGAASFYAIDVDLPAGAPLPNGIGDEDYFAVVEVNQGLEHHVHSVDRQEPAATLKRSGRKILWPTI